MIDKVETHVRQGGKQILSRGASIDMTRETGICGPHSRHLSGLVWPEREA